MAKRTPIDGNSQPGPDRRRVDRLPDPDDSGHFDAIDPAIAPDDHIEDGIVAVPTDVLTAAASPRDGEPADPPPATPDVQLMASEPSLETGSGGGAGRSFMVPDAGERVLSAAMGIVNPVHDPSYAIRHAEEQARVLIIGQHWANMLQAVSPPTSRLVDDDDIRGVYRKVRLMAATRGLDLDGEGAGS